MKVQLTADKLGHTGLKAGDELSMGKGLKDLVISYITPKIYYHSETKYFMTVTLKYNDNVEVRSTIHKADLITGAVSISYDI